MLPPRCFPNWKTSSSTARRKSGPRRCGVSPRLFLDGAAHLQRRPCRAVRRRHRLPDRGDRGQGAGRTRAPASRRSPMRRPASCSTLADNDDIDVAGPVLEQASSTSPNSCTSPRPRARRICWRCRRARASARRSSDVLVARGDRDVSRSIATNQDARLSENAFTTLVKRAEQDGVLAEKVGMRTDIPPRLFRQLADAGERRGAEAAAGAGQARDAGRNPPRSGESHRRSRRPRPRRATTPRRSRRCARCTRSAS